MKTSLIALFMILGFNANADRLSYDIGLSNDTYAFESYDIAAKKTYYSSSNKISSDVGVSYLKTFNFPVAVEQSLALNSNSVSDLTKVFFIRYDLVGSIKLIGILSDFSFKIGPSVVYYHNSISNKDSTGFGSRVSFEYRINEEIFVDLGFYGSKFLTTPSGYESEMNVKSTKIKIGFGF